MYTKRHTTERPREGAFRIGVSGSEFIEMTFDPGPSWSRQALMLVLFFEVSHMSLVENLLRRVDLGNQWDFKVSPRIETIPLEAVVEMIVVISNWMRHFAQEDTWVRKRFGVPSLFVRLDCVWSRAHGLQIFEVEDKPCGMHAAALVDRRFAARRDLLRQEWPDFRFVLGGERRITDDAGWLGPGVSLTEALRHGYLVLVRCQPEHTQYHGLRSRSVSTIASEGDKSYGEAMGLWKIVREADDLPTEGAFFVKPLQGTRCHGVSVCLNGANEIRKIVGRGDVAYLEGEELIRDRSEQVSRTQVIKRLQEEGALVCQPFIRPLRSDDLPGMNIIYRVHFGYSPKRCEWIPLGGYWLGSPTLRVHGSAKTSAGPLVLEGI